MTWRELIIYGIKQYIDYLSKRSVYAWGIRYFSISIVAEIIKASFNDRIELIYSFLQEEIGAWTFLLVWFIIEILLGGFRIFFIWISIPIKIGLVVFFSILHYRKTTSNTIFRPSKKWFNQIYSKYYSADIKLKYVEGLHHTTSVEKKDLKFILDFDAHKQSIIEKVIDIRDQFESFEKGFKKVRWILNDGEKKIPDYKAYQTLPNLLNNQLPRIKIALKKIDKRLIKKHYKSIKIKVDNLDFVEINWIDFKPRERQDFKNWTQDEQVSFNEMIQAHNYLLSTIESLNYYINTLNQRSLYISGNAGVGKTHLAAHLTNELRLTGDYPIFLKAELFSGEEIRLDSILPKILDVPLHYNSSEVLKKLDHFGRKKNSRVFFIIDALNETTDNKIGFSKIWRIHLQNFASQLSEFSNLFLICTLRTSYVDRIWRTMPDNLITIKGYDSFRDREEACKLYFNYYKINVNNINTADLSHFRNPLLLDLYCKLINEPRKETANIDLNFEAYIEVFEDYIFKLKEEVRVKKNLAVNTSLNAGFNKSSTRFLNNNEAICTIEEFVSDFDVDLNVSEDESIAKAVLEGYLIFIKDFIKSEKLEIVKFTQQEIGGFVLAQKLKDEFPILDDLLKSDRFLKQLIGDKPEDQHQLRFDILKFLIASNPDIIRKVPKKEIIDLSWWYLYNANQVKIPAPVIEFIKTSPNIHKQIFQLVEASESFWLNDNHPYNFNFVLEIFQNLSQWEYDISWNQYIYYDAYNFQFFISEYSKDIENEEFNGRFLLKTKVVTTLLSSNSRELRDKATLALLNFGKIYPLELLNLTKEFEAFPDIYIYQRLIQSCYGVAMIKQNDQNFVKNYLPVYAKELFANQFDAKPKHPVYNYIVIDAIKHIVDLAIFLDVFTLPENEYNQLNKYQFAAPFEWVNPSVKQQEIVNKSSEMSPPDPLRMDFGIYTIPRLIIKDTIDKDLAIANVWKRILELGYLDIDFNSTNDIDKDFFWGEGIYRLKGKVDRLGKKYCWIAFFDYAGKLLLENQLDVWYKEDSSYEAHYERLGDVDIDISYPTKEYIIKERLFLEDLLKEKKESKRNWSKINKIDLCKTLFQKEFDKKEYTMLYGFIEQKEDESYDTRSFLMIETVLIDANQIEHLKSLNDKVYRWEDDIHISPNYLYDVYFGELYWADTIPKMKRNNVYIPTGKFTKSKRLLSQRDILETKFKGMKAGEEVPCDLPEKISAFSEPTLMDFIWETNSETFKQFSEYIPSVNIGKNLGLKADCATGRILDSNLNEAYKCFDYDDQSFFSNNLNYLRTDLLEQYMEDKGLSLVYQVKQHSYSPDSPHYRKLKYFIR
ncbi:hypothetical protein [Winogradskyella sediminis]|uniref:nSTAND3 domain-containing NTPase n=1 Tax=Winogradskyella sediminis TaxID=1382466 RepID=UPI003AA8E44B